MLAVFVTVPFWYVGFDTIPQAAEERREGSSLRRLGLYVVLAIIGSTAFYIAIILGAGMAAPWRGIVDEDLPTAAAFSAAFESRLLVRLVLVAGIIGLLTSWNGFFLAGSRVLFSLGRGHIIHSSFGETHVRYGTPARAVLFSGVVTFLSAWLGRGAILAFVDVGSFCIALAFLGVALSLVTLRKRFPDLERPYRRGGRRLALHPVRDALPRESEQARVAAGVVDPRGAQRHRDRLLVRGAQVQGARIRERPCAAHPGGLRSLTSWA
jgi:amino acid transporter